MSAILGPGILPGGPVPGTYRELVDFFQGDRQRADAWLVAQLSYTGDPLVAELLLVRLAANGPPASVELKLDAAPSGAMDAFDIIAQTHILTGDEPFVSSLATSYTFTVT